MSWVLLIFLTILSVFFGISCFAKHYIYNYWDWSLFNPCFGGLKKNTKVLCSILLVVFSVLSQQEYLQGISNVARTFCLQIESVSFQSQLNQLSVNACCDNDYFFLHVMGTWAPGIALPAPFSWATKELLTVGNNLHFPAAFSFISVFHSQPESPMKGRLVNADAPRSLWPSSEQKTCNYSAAWC